MILYTVKQTIERCKLKMPERLSPEMSMPAHAIIKRDAGLLLRERGIKLFYFDGKSALQSVNFASRLTLLLFDIKVSGLGNLVTRVEQYMLDLYTEAP